MSVLYHAKVLFDYEAVEPTELSVKAGTVVAVREINETGWCLVKYENKAGWVPLDYVEKVESPAPAPAQAPASAPEAKVDGSQDVSKALENLNVAMDSTSGTTTKESCHACNKPIADRFCVAQDHTFHVDCFKCATCSASLAGQKFIEKDGAFYCEDDFYRKFNPPCAYCNDVIKGRYITALGQSWHPEHFVCTECHQPFSGNQFRKHDDKPYCEEHFNKLFGTVCSKCNQNISGQVFTALGKKFHLECFSCEVGPHPIGENTSFHVYEEKIYCPKHFDELFLQKCSGCGQLIKAQYVKILEQHYHPECWKCSSCSTVLKPETAAQYQEKFVCKPCHGKLVADHAKANAQVGNNAYEQAAKAVNSRPLEDSHAAPEQQLQQPQGPMRKASSPQERAEQLIQLAAQGGSLKAPEEVKKIVAPNGEVYYPYAVLKNGQQFPAGVDSKKREIYLAPDVFQMLFKMPKEEFAKLKGWRQEKMKKDLELW